MRRLREAGLVSGWWDGRLVGFDLETTGTDPEEARIVSAALVEVGGGLPLRERAWLVDPGIEIPEAASAVHGISTKRAREEGVPAEVAVPEIVMALQEALTAPVPLVIFNARYDLTVLDREASRHDVDPYPPRWVVDPLVLDRWLDRYRRGSRKLDAMLAQHGVDVGHEAHDATSDALNACRLAWKLVRVSGQRAVKLRVRSEDDGRERARMWRQWDSVRVDLAALHDFQAAVAWQEADRLAAYFARVGRVDDAAGVRREWPVISIGATE